MNPLKERTVTSLLPYAVVSGFFIVLYIIFKNAFSIIAPFIVAWTIAIIADPAVNKLSNHMPRKAASFITLTTLYITAIFVSILFSRHLLKYMPLHPDSLTQHLNKAISALPPKVASLVKENIQPEKLLTGPIGSAVIKNASAMVSKSTNIFGAALVSVIGSFCFSMELPAIRRLFLSCATPRIIKITKQIKSSISSAISGYLHASLLLIIVTFLELFTFMILFRFDNALSLSLLISFIDAFPILGVGFILIPWALLNFFNRNISKGLLLISFYIIISTVRQILEPRIIGNKLGLSPLATLIAIWSGLNLLGFIGIPLFPAAAVIIKDLFILISKENTGGNHRFKRKIL